MKTKLDIIRERLKAITPGKWETDNVRGVFIEDGGYVAYCEQPID